MASKALEHAVLDVCVKAVPGFPSGRARAHESPDFLVAMGDSTTGIEMQEFIQGAGADGGAPARKAESFRAMMMRSAQREFESRHPATFLYVYAHWQRSAQLESRSAPEVARDIASIVEGLIPPSPASGEVVSRREAGYEELSGTALADRLTHLTVLLYPPATYGLWSSPEAGTSSRDLDELSQHVRAKEPKIPAYRRVCDDLWLVIYALALPSGGFDLEAVPSGWRVPTEFDHVVFVDVISRTYAVLAG